MATSSEQLMMGLPRMFRRLWHQLKLRRKRQFIAIVALVVVSALAEVVSLGAVLPFLGVLTAPERVLRYPVVGHLMRTLGAASSGQLVLLLAAAFAAAAVISGVLRMLLLWASTRVAFATGSDFGGDVYRRTLYQPYQIQITRNTSELISGVTGNLADTVYILHQFLNLLSSIVLLVFIMIALFAIDPFVASLAMAGFGGSYAAIICVESQTAAFL